MALLARGMFPVADPKFPFSAKLNELFFKPRKQDNQDFALHGPNVIRLVGGLLSVDTLTGKTLQAIPGLISQQEPKSAACDHVFFTAWPELQRALEIKAEGPDLERERRFLTLCALYHDLGKVIRRDRHPEIGANLLRSFNETEQKNLVRLLAESANDGGDEDAANNRFSRLVSVVRHHDKFGVVSTGEASLPIFSDILYFRSDEDSLPGILKNVTMVMLTNLADIAAVLPPSGNESKSKAYDLAGQVYQLREGRQSNQLLAAHGEKTEDDVLAELGELCLNPAVCLGLTENKLRKVLGDWHLLIKAIEHPDVRGDRGHLRFHLTQLERNPARTLERILRLLRTCSSQAGAWEIGKHITSTQVESVLVGTLGSHQFQRFCDELATVVKLDYGLRFFTSVMAAVIRRKMKTHNQPRFWAPLALDEIANLKAMTEGEKLGIAEAATVTFFEVLQGLLSRYVGIVGSRFEEPRRFGFQMASLTQNDEIIATILDFLCLQRTKRAVALTWITDEVSIFSVD